MTTKSCGTCAHADCEQAGLVESCERWTDTDDARSHDSAPNRSWCFMCPKGACKGFKIIDACEIRKQAVSA